MDWSSWFRRSNRNPQTPNPSSLHKQQQEESEEELGVTHQLIDHVKSFTLQTFKDFPLKAELEGAAADAFGDEILSTSNSTEANSANVQKDLSKWQERHATLVLCKVKELSQLRFKLCPGRLKERDFWRIYFTLVKSHVAEYELRAIQMAKIKRMAMEKEKRSETGGFEVEMSETKQSASSDPPTP